MALDRMPAGGNDLGRIFAAAAELAGKGRPEEAIRLLETTGKAGLAHPIGKNLLGSLYLRTGQHRDALKVLDAAAKMAPNFPEAHCNRGAALHKLNRLEEALAALDRALKLRPAYPLAHLNRGIVLFALGRAEEAIAAHDAAIRLQANFPEAHFNRGLARLFTGRAIEALADFDRAAAQRSGYMDARVGRIEALARLERHAEVAAAAEAILRDAPDHRTARIARARALGQLQRSAEALALIDQLIAETPDDADLHLDRSVALGDLRRHEDALAAIDRAAAIAPGRADIQIARASTCAELGLLEETLAACDRAERLGAHPDEVAAVRARTFGGFGRAEEAIRLYEKILERSPGDPGLRRNLSFTLLSVGDFERGWREYEQRLLAPDAGGHEIRRAAPAWKGEDIGDERLLVYCEQGLGDTIQFVRYMRLVEGRCRNVILAAPPSLHGLIRPILDRTTVMADHGLRGLFDRQVALLSLPHVFGTRIDTIPLGIPYLKADPARVDKWRGRLGADGFKVGIIWQGNPRFRGDRSRSAPLRHYAPLAAIPGVRLISLQAAHGLDQLKALPPGMTVETLGEEVTNNPDGVAEVAAIIETLDLVIMSDSGMAHLTGALGKPIWVALQAFPDWRWLNQGSTNPWYPTMRLFRQRTPGDWPQVFGDIAEALRERVATAR